MANKPKPDTGDSTQVKPGMEVEDMRASGVPIDLPYEAPPGDPARLQYDDQMDDEKGWEPPEGFTIAGVPFEEVVAGAGRGPLPGPPEEDLGGQQ